MEGFLGSVDELIALVLWFRSGVWKLAGHEEVIGPLLEALIDELQSGVHLFQHYGKSKRLDMGRNLLSLKH